MQEAFVETGAVQCGFCTPGLVVATVDLLAHTPQPTDDEIREALSGNLCRCTGYAKIFDAVRLAAGRDRANPPARAGRIGESAKRADAVPKTTGEFAYSSDLYATGMLWGHTLRSPHAHARIVEIDLSDALTVPGVHAVLTHEDVPGQKRYGLEFPDQPVLAFDRVRYFGEPVAVVAAEDPEQARRAAERIRISYEPSIPWSTSSGRLSSRRFTTRLGRTDTGTSTTRAQRRAPHRHPPRRPRRAGQFVSGFYELGQQDQAFLGPESGPAVPDGEGGVDIYVATQWLHVDRDQVALCLDRARSECGSTWRASAARSAAARTSRCRSTARCSRCTRTAP